MLNCWTLSAEDPLGYLKYLLDLSLENCFRFHLYFISHVYI